MTAVPDRFTPPFALRVLDAAAAAQAVDGLADVLVDCVHGGASIGFMAPLAHARALAFWHGVTDSVARGERTLLVAEDADGSVVGTAQLLTAMPDNQPHRAEVAKMLVHRRARRQGVAQRLLAAVEDAARAQGRTLLVLDTATGSDAERLYARAGWQRAGMVPGYALMPDGTPCGTTIFYKQV